jgi:hypothetical protein
LRFKFPRYLRFTSYIKEYGFLRPIKIEVPFLFIYKSVLRPGQPDVGDSAAAVKTLLRSSPPSRTIRTLFGNKTKLPGELGSLSSEAFVDVHRGLQNSPSRVRKSMTSSTFIIILYVSTIYITPSFKISTSIPSRSSPALPVISSSHPH